MKTDDEIREIARRVGYGANADAFVEGYKHVRDTTALDYPGPARSAHQAGWINGNADAILGPKPVEPEQADLPPAGWEGPDGRGFYTFVEHGNAGTPPERPGYEAFFVGVHGNRYTRWTYRPIVEGDFVTPPEARGPDDPRDAEPVRPITAPKLRLTLEEARVRFDPADRVTGPEATEVDLGTFRFVEVQDGWITAWNNDDNPDGMPVEKLLIETDAVDEITRVWAIGEITRDNWLYEGSRLNILPA